MKKVFSKITSLALTAIMLTSSLAVAPTSVLAAPTMSAGGWNETIYANLSGVKDANVTAVTYSGAMSGSLTGEDLQYLVRDEGSGVRIDIPGLKPGDYTLTVKTSSGDVTKNVTVPAQDRSGYAHYGYKKDGFTAGIGAYNNDGTLKANAKVIYVTDANKDTVTVTSKDGTTVTGIGHILNSAGKESSGGKNSKGGLANKNKDIIKKLAQDGTPLVVRFVGSVSAPDGLTAYNSLDYGGTVGDNGFMARMQSGKDVTIEGIGHDAQIKGWGVHFIAESATANKFGQSFEVRNLEFWGSPEDSIGMEGQQEGNTITAPVNYIWIHNNSFLPQKISNPAESDKAEGDGCCDFKRGYYMTMSYNYFYKAHKTSLIGSSDTSLQYHVTWHHNMWEDCEARGPLGRQADVHIYNNYYLRQSSYAMNPRANCYIFSEANTMEYCKNPMDVKLGAIKSFNDVLLCCSGAQMGTVVTDKSTPVNTANKFANFDTNAGVCYIPDNDYALDTASEAKAKILAYAGPMKESVISETDVDASIISDSNKPAEFAKLPVNHVYDKANGFAVGNMTKDGVVYNLAKVGSGEMTITGEGIVFSVGQKVTVKMTAPSGAVLPVLTSDTGVKYLEGAGEVTLEAGTYVIQANTFDPGKKVFKEAKVNSLEIKAFDASQTTTAKPVEPKPSTTTTEKVTEPTSKESTEATTKSTTTTTEEESSETTTEFAPEGGIAAMGTYIIGTAASGGTYNVKEKVSSHGNIDFNFRSISTGDGSIRAGYADSIDFTLDKKTKVEVTVANRDAKLINISSFVENTLPKGAATVLTLDAGSYSIEGADTASNTKISKLVLTAAEEGGSTGGDTPTPTPTPTPATYTVNVGSAAAKVGEAVTVPVKLEKAAVIGGYKATVKYDSTALELTAVTNPYTNIDLDYMDNKGTVTVAVVNADSVSTDVLFNLEFKAKAAAAGAEITVTFDEMFDSDMADITPTVNKGTVTVTQVVVATGLKGDVNGDKAVDNKDAALLLGYLAGVKTLTADQLANADCDGDSAVDMRDVSFILGMSGVTTALSKGTTYSAATVLSDSNSFYLTSNATTASNQLKISTGRLFFVLNEGDTISVSFKCGSSDTKKSAGIVINGNKSSMLAGGAGNDNFEFTAPATGVYAISAYDIGGTSAQINSISVK